MDLLEMSAGFVALYVERADLEAAERPQERPLFQIVGETVVEAVDVSAERSKLRALEVARKDHHVGGMLAVAVEPAIRLPARVLRRIVLEQADDVVAEIRRFDAPASNEMRSVDGAERNALHREPAATTVAPAPGTKDILP